MADELPPSREIPAAFGASLKSWWYAGEKESAVAEERLLRRLPFYRSSSTPAPGEPVTAHSSLVHLSNPKHYLNTLTIASTTPSSTAPPPAVLLHGYGAGLGFFFLNFPSFASWASAHHTSVYALDWLGMGRSARVPFTIKSKRENTKARVAEAESFFIDSLEEWRTKMGLEKMTLIGHSLGAYFSVAYTLKYPERVNKLILLSPAGVTRPPGSDDVEREVIDEAAPGESTKPREDSTFHRATKGRLKKMDAERDDKRDPPQSRTRRLLYHLWEEGWSPFQVLRSTLFYSPLLIGKYTSRRFPSLPPLPLRDLHDYITNITLAKPSGEYCVSHVLAPGAHARLPLVDRIPLIPKHIDITFVYGEHDWMDPLGGMETIEKLKQVRCTKQGDDERARMYVVEDAGHHVYLDNVEVVDKLIRGELEREPTGANTRHRPNA